jgi:hypothetical protein
MAHARRKFDEALKALPKESRKNKTGMAQTGLIIVSVYSPHLDKHPQLL